MKNKKSRNIAFVGSVIASFIMGFLFYKQTKRNQKCPYCKKSDYLNEKGDCGFCDIKIY